jgi:hypothetical protein
MIPTRICPGAVLAVNYRSVHLYLNVWQFYRLSSQGMSAITEELNLSISDKRVTLGLRVRYIIVSMYEYRGPNRRPFDVAITFPLEIDNMWPVTSWAVEHIAVKGFPVTFGAAL